MHYLLQSHLKMPIMQRPATLELKMAFAPGATGNALLHYLH
jgi:hypothetical protein